MINKVVGSLSEAVSDIEDGCTVLIGGFGNSGIPDNLIAAVVAKGVKDLTIITNNAGSGDSGVASLLKNRIVKKIVTSYPRSRGSIWFEELYKSGEIELELLPQGKLTEKVREAGAGIGAFYTPIGVGTLLGKDKEQKIMTNIPVSVIEETILDLPAYSQRHKLAYGIAHTLTRQHLAALPHLA